MGLQNIIVAIVTIGVIAGFLAILTVVGFDRLRKRLGDDDSGPMVPKTLMGGLGIGGLIGPGALIARAGQRNKPRMSLNTVVMTPTPGLRVISLGGSALLLALLWSPAMMDHFGDLTLRLLVTAMVGYAVILIAGYEARYDADGITAPNWLFVDKHYPWEEFISIKDDGHYLYRLQFESGKVALQKYLVGMPTFLTFVTDLKAMNKGA